MDGIGLLIGVVFALGLVLLLLASYQSYTRKRRVAQARRLAALNTLLAEADEIAQQAHSSDPADPDAPPTRPESS